MLPSPPTFRLRKLHRSRTRRASTVAVLNEAELCANFDCRPDELESTLRGHSLQWHKDSSGQRFASVPKTLLARRGS